MAYNDYGVPMGLDWQSQSERDLLIEELQRNPRAEAMARGGVTGPGYRPTVEPGYHTGPEIPAAAPAPYQAQGPALGLEGFDAGKLASGHVSPKYVFAKHAQGLGVSDKDELLRRLQGDESGYFKNASFGGSKGDKLIVGGDLDPKFNGLREFDVIRAAGEGGKGWQWNDANAAGAAPQLAPSMSSGLSAFQGIQGLMPTDTDFYNRLQAQLQDILGGSQGFEREALLQLLSGNN